jgi:hypothetical protein
MKLPPRAISCLQVLPLALALVVRRREAGPMKLPPRAISCLQVPPLTRALVVTAP